MPVQVQKGGGITITLAIFFFLLCAYPILAGLCGNYESEMAGLVVFLGIPCLILGTVSGFVGLAKGHSRCKLGLWLLWGTLVCFVIVTFFVL